MADEFDDLLEPIALPRAGAAAGQSAGLRPAAVPRLVCRLYGAASPTLRATLLRCLVKPLGTLGLAGVAAGAFGGLLYRGGAHGVHGAVTVLDDVSRFSNDQVIELARFVEQVSPDALQEFAQVIAGRPVGMAAFSVAAAVLLMQVLLQRRHGRAAKLGRRQPPNRTA